MSDLTITAASVRPLGGCICRRFIAGETLTPGQPVYVSGNDTVSRTVGTEVATAACIGLVISNSNGAVSFSADEYVDVVLLGPVTGFATNLAAGTLVYVDNDAGVLADGAGTKTTIVGIGLNTTDLFVRPQTITVT